MKNWLIRLKEVWQVFIHGLPPHETIPVPSADLWDMNHPYVKAVRDAVEKVEADTGFQGVSGAMKRKEAVTWAGHYLRDRYQQPMPETSWSFNFLVEYLVGKRRGYL